MTRVGLAIVLFALLYVAYSLAWQWGGGQQGSLALSAQHYSDTTLLYAIMPGYFLTASVLVRRRTLDTYRHLLNLAGDSDKFLASDFVKPVWLIVGALLGFSYGFTDYPYSPDAGFEQRLVEASLKLGNGIVWTSAGILIGWRLAWDRLFIRLGQQVSIDLLRLADVKPVGTTAALDVFVAMGALALMPLQSINSKLQWEQFEAGFAVGIPASIALLILPQLGVRRNVRARKRERLQSLQLEIDAIPPGNTIALETLLAHRDRISDVQEWPIDTKVLSRAVLYLIVPPLAWVGAAIVERGVDQIL